MGKSKVYYLAQDQFDKVPAMIEKAAGDFIKENTLVALKLHFGEKGNKGFIKPEWVKPVAKWVKTKKASPFLTDTNTIYRGNRSDAVNHLMLAQGHGFKIEKVGAPVIIACGLRGQGADEVQIDGDHYKSVQIARAIRRSGAMIVLSHTKGHILTGFGGAIKNLGMGCAVKAAKYSMHAGMVPKMEVDKCVACGACVKWCAGHALTLVNDKIVLDDQKCVGCGECIIACPKGVFDVPWQMGGGVVQEKIAEHAAGAVKDKPVCYVNYMHFITRNCDCMPTEKEGALLDDLGILISTDPVAIDQASIDYINKMAGKDLLKELNPVDCTVQLAHAEKMGLGKREYEWVA